MITFFLIVVIVGVLWLFVESAAKSSSVAPSMVRTSGNGWLLIIVGMIGAMCAGYLS